MGGEQGWSHLGIRIMVVLLDVRTEASEGNTNKKAVPWASQASRRKAEKGCLACSAI